MTRKNSRGHMRESIAHMAARLMAEDGIDDYAQAKRKAARQIGVIDARQLPDNEEIDVALRQYRALFQNEHASELRQMRQLALAIMNELSAFDPHLVGSLLNGNAGKYADIHLQLFSDNSKSVEHYLLDRNITFRSTEARLYSGDIVLTVPVLACNRDGFEIYLTLLSPRELRLPLKSSRAGKPIERAKADAVAALIAGH
jgi:hypothetical protein